MNKTYKRYFFIISLSLISFLNPIITLADDEYDAILRERFEALTRFSSGIILPLVGVLAGFIALLWISILLDPNSPENLNKNPQGNEHKKPLPLYKQIVFQTNFEGSHYEKLNNRIKDLVSKETLTFEQESYKELTDPYKIPIHLSMLKKRFHAIYSEHPEYIQKYHLNAQTYMKQLLTTLDILTEFNAHNSDIILKSSDLTKLANNIKLLQKMLKDSNRNIEFSYNPKGFVHYNLQVLDQLKKENLDKDFNLLGSIMTQLGNQDFLDLLNTHSVSVYNYVRKEKETEVERLEKALNDYKRINDL